MDWQIFWTVLGGAFGGALIGALATILVTILNHKHEHKRWIQQERIQLYSSIVKLQKELHSTSKKFAEASKDVFDYADTEDSNPEELEALKAKCAEYGGKLHTLLEEIDIQHSMIWMLGTSELAERHNILGTRSFNYFHALPQLDVAHTDEQTLRNLERVQSIAWNYFLEQAQKDLGVFKSFGPSKLTNEDLTFAGIR